MDVIGIFSAFELKFKDTDEHVAMQKTTKKQLKKAQKIIRYT